MAFSLANRANTKGHRHAAAGHFHHHYTAHPRTVGTPEGVGAALAGWLPLDARNTVLADNTEIGFGVAPPDSQFAQIFRSSCRQPPTEEELVTVNHYTVNTFLTGPGGSMDAARTMMLAGSALIQAGGAGVFIDNSTVAHGGKKWLAMTEDGGPDALSFAFVAIVAGKADVWTMGMHVLGLRDVLMKKADLDKDDFDIIEVIRYLARNEKAIEDGHLLADLDGPRFRAFVQESPKDLAGSPMHNPFGRLKLVSMRDVAEAN